MSVRSLTTRQLLLSPWLGEVSPLLPSVEVQVLAALVQGQETRYQGSFGPSRREICPNQPEDQVN